MADNRGYYGIIPAEVRYDKELSAEAKLLYAEITALAIADGYCYASNEYFSCLFNVAERTIIRRINELESKKYIKKIEIKTGSVVVRRHIYPMTNMAAASDKTVIGTGDKTVTDNNISTELLKNNNKEKIYKKKFESPTLDEVEEYGKLMDLVNVDPSQFWLYYEAANWKDSQGKQVRNWKQKMIMWNKKEIIRPNTKKREVYTTDEMNVSEEIKNVDFDAIKKGWKK